MTAKFDAFMVALEALCVEHGVRLSDDDCDYGSAVTVLDAKEGEPTCCGFCDETAPSPEERAANEERMRHWREQQAIRDAQAREEHERAFAEVLSSPTYNNWLQQAEAEAKQQRNEQMRISTDPKDPAYIDDRPRKAWCNDVEIEGWTVADEFRRCVVTPTKVHNGSVRIERLADDYVPNFTLAQAEAPIHAGFSGVFVNDTPAATPAPTAAPTPAAAPVAKKPKAKRRR